VLQISHMMVADFGLCLKLHIISTPNNVIITDFVISNI